MQFSVAVLAGVAADELLQCLFHCIGSRFIMASSMDDNLTAIGTTGNRRPPDATEDFSGLGAYGASLENLVNGVDARLYVVEWQARVIAHLGRFWRMSGSVALRLFVLRIVAVVIGIALAL